MKWKAKNDFVGIPGKGYIKAEDFNQDDENLLVNRAKNRGIDVNVFMLGAGFVPVKGPQLEIQPEEEFIPDPIEDKSEEEKPKRKRRTKAEMEADGE